MTIQSIIEVRDLSFSYQDQPIIYKASCTVYPNEFIGMIGPMVAEDEIFKVVNGFFKASIRIYKSIWKRS